MPGIDAAITDHFVMFFRNMEDKPFDKFHNGDCFFHILPIFMAVVMESDKVAVIFINPGGSDDGASKISVDILRNRLGITFVGFGIDIETFLVLPVTVGLNLFKG